MLVMASVPVANQRAPRPSLLGLIVIVGYRSGKCDAVGCRKKSPRTRTDHGFYGSHGLGTAFQFHSHVISEIRGPLPSPFWFSAAYGQSGRAGHPCAAQRVNHLSPQPIA